MFYSEAQFKASTGITSSRENEIGNHGGESDEKRKCNNHFLEKSFYYTISEVKYIKIPICLSYFSYFHNDFILERKLLVSFENKPKREMEKPCCLQNYFFPIFLCRGFSFFAPSSASFRRSINKEKCRTKLWYGSSNIVFVFDEL